MEGSLEDHVSLDYRGVSLRGSKEKVFLRGSSEQIVMFGGTSTGCVSVLRTHPYMYPRRSTILDTYSDMYVKDEVLLVTMQCKTW